MTTSAPSSSAPSSRRRAVARAVQAAARPAGRPDVVRMWDEAETTSVDVLVCRDAPDAGLTTWSTVSLHETTNLDGGKDVRVELVAVGRSDLPILQHVLATLALGVIKDARLAAPDVVVPDAVAADDPTRAMRHVLLGDPFPFEELGAVAIDEDLTVHWLLAVPIDDAELALALADGVPALSRRLEAADAPYYDLDRASSV